MLAWHWTLGGFLRNRAFVPAIGEWLEYTGPVEMCLRGLHASVSILDALKYAPGCTLHRVEVDCIEKMVSDKLVCRRRRVLASAHMEWPLLEFAETVALRNPTELIKSGLVEAHSYESYYIRDESITCFTFSGGLASWVADICDEALCYRQGLSRAQERRWMTKTLLMYAKAYGLLKGET